MIQQQQQQQQQQPPNTNNSANPQRNILGIPFGRCIMWVRDWYRSSAFSNGRHLSGLPLLFYNAHILWSCRALEGDISSYSYARLLWGLTLVAFLLDLWFTFTVLSMVRDMNHATSSPFLMGASLTSSGRSRSRSASSRPAVAQQLQLERLLSRRSIGSLTIVTSALLVIFRDRFPYVPLQVVPFLEARTHLLPVVFDLDLNFDVPPPFTYGLCVALLLVLSYPVHPIASVACGTLSGMLWTSEVTSFLVQPYWSNGSIACYLMVCLLSLKASGSSWIPCVEYVSWDARGRFTDHRRDQHPHHHHHHHHHGPLLVVESIEQQQHEGRGGDDSSDTSSHSLEEESANELPLFGSPRTTTTTTTTSRDAEDDNSSLRHRLPMMGDLDDEDEDDNDDDDNDNDNDEHHPLVSNAAAAAARSTTMRSRRTPSVSRV
jgi:hypothetical protein